MSCNDPCNNSPIHYPKKYTKTSGDCGCTDASNILYTGADLPCSSISSNTNLEDVLKAFDAQMCSILGDYTTYNTHCLADEYTIETEAQFVSAITDYVCNFRETYNTFVGTTYPAGLLTLQDQIDDINYPNLALCTYSGIVVNDSQSAINTKLANKLCDLNSRLDLTTVTWNGCYTVATPPTTLPQAFQLLSDQICQAAGTGGGTSLPTFNNQGSCLPAPLGTADSLTLTINKIKTRLCQSAVYNIDDSPWGCIANPNAGGGADIQSAFDAVLPIVDDLLANQYTFDSNQFNLTQITEGDACSGFIVTIDPSVGISDNKVGATNSDTNPSYLQDKLEGGTNITLDYTDPEKVVINSSFTDEKVKVTSGGSAGYLQDKIIEGSDSNGISLDVSTVSDQVVITPLVDVPTLAQQLMLSIQNDTDLYNQFCNLACGCSPCSDSSTTTTSGSTLRLYFENQSTEEDVELDVLINQNSPTVSFENIGYYIAANGAVATGYHPLTTSNSPKTIDLTFTNPARQTYDIQVEVRLGSGGALIGGATTYSNTGFTTYTNPSFNIGSVTGDIVIKVIFSNVVTL